MNFIIIKLLTLIIFYKQELLFSFTDGEKPEHRQVTMCLMLHSQEVEKLRFTSKKSAPKEAPLTSYPITLG